MGGWKLEGKQAKKFVTVHGWERILGTGAFRKSDGSQGKPVALSSCVDSQTIVWSARLATWHPTRRERLQQFWVERLGLDGVRGMINENQRLGQRNVPSSPFTRRPTPHTPHPTPYAPHPTLRPTP
jgi:hypothetical protein